MPSDTLVAPAISGSEPAPAAVTPAPAVIAPVVPVAAPVAVAPEVAVAPLAPTTLLTEPPVAATPEAPVAPVEAAPAEGTAPAEPPAPETPPAPTYAEFTFPEGLKGDPERIAEATKLFGKYNIPQDGAQEMVDLYAAELTRAQEAILDQQKAYWSDVNAKWVEAAKSDPQIGGNRFETSLNVARGAIAEFAGTKEQRDALWKDLSDTGMGNNPGLVRAFVEAGSRIQDVYRATGTTNWADAMKKLSEPVAPPPGTPPRAPGSAGRPADRRYSATTRTQGA